MAHRVLHVDKSILNPEKQQLLRECLHESCELVIPESFDTETILREAKTARVMITGFAPLTGEMMRAAPDLCAVGRGGTGMDSVDVATATALNIPAMNTPGIVRADPITEHALTFMLMLSRRPWLWKLGRTTVQHNELKGATLGIVGLGNIGQGVAKRSAPFGMKILAHTRTRGKFKPEGFAIEEVESLGDLLPHADYVILSMPLTEENRGLIGENELEMMKDSAFLINVGRGAHIDSDALASALAGGKLGGAGLDVTEPEPLPDGHPLLGMPNALISPHNSTHSAGVQRRSVEFLCENIRRAVEGERVASLVNPEVYD
ncbi:MAG: D-glycerate dehydrogenase [Nitrospinaceae bacterium]|jgi:phosphoglycerate dehydrogenase-like enzyme|nr:D-glycerate dehydrogenase [Nitrospinaceae bacterium]MBT3433720.1 D-glycerate dehydrogenase [Nitrospinaceae bacterium]MBT3819928.1 D-glycerate dehydrogenase [Nitrospinaceae bacterium]MBT4430762.1 D-glycerate dehydrogenase [Nitrospinaceae bacterium]MBT5367074.1 D-glycerate dehydrogenase [Nitrospinaceae bacterium]